MMCNSNRTRLRLAIVITVLCEMQMVPFVAAFVNDVKFSTGTGPRTGIRTTSPFTRGPTGMDRQQAGAAASLLMSPMTPSTPLTFKTRNTCPNFALHMTSNSRSNSNNNSKIRTNKRNRFWNNLSMFKQRRQSSQTLQTSQASFRNDLEMDIPPIHVKPRPIVSFDEVTGMYIPPSSSSASSSAASQTPTTRISSTSKASSSSSSSMHSNQGSKNAVISYQQTNNKDETNSGWDQFKDFVYDIMDSISNIVSLFTNTLNKKDERSNNSILNRKLAVAYSDTVEFKTQGGRRSSSILADDRKKTFESNRSSRNSPSFSSSSSTTTKTSTTSIPTKTIVRQYESSLSASNDDRSDGQNFFKSDTRRNFDSFKDGIYDFFSGTTASAKNSSTTSSTTTTKKSPLQNLSSSTETTIKPVSKPSTNKDDSITSITPYLADLDSPNPIKVIKAKIAIAREENKRQKRIAEQKRRETIDNIKNFAYSIIDSLQSTYNAIIDIPTKVENAVLATEEALEKTKQQTKKTAQDVQAIPSKIQQAVDETKKSVQETKKATLEVVKEVKSIPQKVENTVNEVKRIPEKVEKKVADTKQSIQETKEGVERAVQKVEDLTYEAKVIAGLEKPKPKPPPPPPPPKTKSEIAWDVAGTVAKTTGKAAWFVGKGTVGLTAGAAKFAFRSVVSSNSKDKGNETNKDGEVIEATITKGAISRGGTLLSKFSKVVKKQPNVKMDQNAVPPVTSDITAPKTIGEIDPLLEREVADALRSAEEALDSAQAAADAAASAKEDDEDEDNDNEESSSTLTTIDINEALQKAKLAAAQARKDAEDLESMLEKRKQFFLKS